MSGYLSEYVIIDRDVKLHPTVKIYHFTVIRDRVVIGENSVIGHNVVIERDTKIGKNTTIQSQCHITGEAVIGDNCFFGPGVVTMNEKNIANCGRTKPHIRGPIIGNGVRIGAGAVISPGVIIGDNAFIQAGCFLTKDVAENEIWGHRNGFSKAMRIGIVPQEERL